MKEICCNNQKLMTRIEKKLGFLYCIIAALSTLAINHSDSTLPERDYIIYFHSISLISLIYSCFLIQKNGFICHHKGLFFIFIFWWLIITFYRYDQSTINLGILTFSTLLMFCYLRKKVIYQAFSYYINYITIMSCLGIFAYTCMVFNINVPMTICPYYGVRLGDSFLYFDYYYSYIVIEGAYARLCGLFNEPGYFGTFLSLCLIANGLNFNDKRNLILMIAGCLTFSAAFFITLILYFVFLAIIRKNYYIVLIACVILISINTIEFDNVNIIRLMDRLTFEDGKLTAINRTSNSFDHLFSKVLASSDVFWGYGGGYLVSNDYVGSLSYKRDIIEYGLFACIIYWGSLFVKGIHSAQKNITAVVFVILFMVNIYQRPGIFVAGYMLIFLGGIYRIVYNEQEYSLKNS